MRELWTNRETQFLIENTHRLKDKEIMLILNKLRILAGRPLLNVRCIEVKRARLGIVKGNGRRLNPVIRIHGES